jgi:hypothetical protein
MKTRDMTVEELHQWYPGLSNPDSPVLANGIERDREFMLRRTRKTCPPCIKSENCAVDQVCLQHEFQAKGGLPGINSRECQG